MYSYINLNLESYYSLTVLSFVSTKNKPRLFQLNPDGTRQTDPDGNLLYTYDSDDIMSYARAWTGFSMQKYLRGNLEEEKIRLDPMTVNREKRDVFPKTDLIGGYIGDGFPLCADLPPKMHLRKVSEDILLFRHSYLLILLIKVIFLF